MNTIAARIRGLREQSGISQLRLSKIFKIGQSSVNRYESGETEVPCSVVLKYADYFDVSLDYIFGRTDDPRGTNFECRAKAEKNSLEIDQLVEMCFDPSSPVNAKLKESLKRMMKEAAE